MLEKNNIRLIISGAVLLLVVYFLFFRKKNVAGQKAILNKNFLQGGYLRKVAAKYKGKVLNTRTNDKPVKGYFAAYLSDAPTIEKWAVRIWDAKSPVFGLGDKDNAVLSVFSEIEYLSQAAQIADEFNTRYKRNLSDFLDFMDNDSMARLNTILKGLKTGFYKEQGGKWVLVNEIPIV
jgi:hypothetical protein